MQLTCAAVAVLAVLLASNSASASGSDSGVLVYLVLPVIVYTFAIALGGAVLWKTNQSGVVRAVLGVGCVVLAAGSFLNGLAVVLFPPLVSMLGGFQLALASVLLILPRPTVRTFRQRAPFVLGAAILPGLLLLCLGALKVH